MMPVWDWWDIAAFFAIVVGVILLDLGIALLKNKDSDYDH